LKDESLDQTQLFPLIENQTIKKLEIHIYSDCQHFVKQLLMLNQHLKCLDLYIHQQKYAQFDITKELIVNKNLKQISLLNLRLDIKLLFVMNQTLQKLRYNQLIIDEESLQFLDKNTSLIDIYQSFEITHFERVEAILKRNRKIKFFRKQKLSDLCIKVVNCNQFKVLNYNQ
jgi:hypothetical protein